MNETEKFLADLAHDQEDVNVLEEPLVPEPEKEEEQVADDTKTDDAKPHNRRERRLLEKLQQERESSMFLAGKLEAREEAKRFVTDEERDYLKGIERIYGTDSPEAQLATDMLKKAFVGAVNDAEERAYQRIAAERAKEQEAVQKADAELESYIDDIEETYGVNLTPTQERNYFQLLEKMSPKNRDGEVVQYADPHAVWEVFQERSKQTTDNRAKTLSARSLVQSGASTDSTIQEDSVARTLRDLGII